MLTRSRFALRSISMSPRFFLRLAAVVTIALGLSGCWTSASYRYKLTLAVDTPQGVKRASVVGELTVWDIYFPWKGTDARLRGEALYLDLGPGARPLIALVTAQLRPRQGEAHWTNEAGPGNLMHRIYGQARSSSPIIDMQRIAHARGPRKIDPADLPDLVTFANVNDPGSVIEVDPDDLQATLGPGITWREITLEATDALLTREIEYRLPWIPAYAGKRLDGSRHGASTALANRLSVWNFRQNTSNEKAVNAVVSVVQFVYFVLHRAFGI